MATSFPVFFVCRLDHILEQRFQLSKMFARRRVNDDGSFLPSGLNFLTPKP
jgi:hypothetical protein